jgi:beta-1,4-mannosyl-glycoprotein beta-1,4-N-acetylglucosaminyltransferase
MFYNEMDLLNYRLHLLNDVVDYFVIVESTHTHVGKEKQLWYGDNVQLFAEFADKIIHVVVDDFLYKYPTLNVEKSEQWENERAQRNAISRGIDRIVDLKEDDLIIITDCDEIPDPITLHKIKTEEIDVEFNSLSMDFYYYNLNAKLDSQWNNGKIISHRMYKESNLSCNSIRYTNCPVIQHGGWHLSYFGDAYFIKNKLENFTHQEYNNNYFTNINVIENKLRTFTNLHDAKRISRTSIEDNNYLPPYYDIYLTRYYK